MTPPVEAFSVPPWAAGVVVLLVTFGPGLAGFFFMRWLRKKDEAEKEAKEKEAAAEKEAKEKDAAAAKAAKEADEKKLDEVLSIAKKLDTEVGGLSQRLALSDALQNQLKGSLEKVEERINGIGNTYGRRLGDLEALVQRLDERTRNDAPRRRK